MTRTARRLLLGLTMAIMAVFFAAWLAADGVRREAVRPESLEELAAYLTEHPADWLAATAMTDKALDSALPRRQEVWRAAFAHATRLAPRRPNAAAAFVRAGLFHWYELNANDRRDVLRVAAPLLGEQAVFARLHRPLWELTGDFEYLRKNAPATERALMALQDIAAMYGRFDEYRDLRGELHRRRLETFEVRHASLPPLQLVALLPPRLTAEDQPLVRRLLEELHRRPLDPASAASVRAHVDELVAFAIRHGLRPLEGLEAMIESSEIRAATRARLAVALGRAEQASTIELAAAANEPQWAPYFLERAALEAARGDATLAAFYRRRAAAAGGEGGSAWSGTCGQNEVCRAATAVVRGPLSLDIQNVQSDEVPPYVEIYVDDALVAEGIVEDLRHFAVIADTERHRVEVRLANPWTRNRIQRRVRLS